MVWLNLIWIVLLLIFLVPLFRQRMLEVRRFEYLRNIERKRGSRVITLIDRRKGISFFGVPIWESIDIEDAEEILRAVRLTPSNMPIDLVVHTPGGLALATEQIVYTLLGHGAPVTIFVPHFAMSGGTLLVLAADEIVMDEHAVLGNIDPQVQGFPASSIVKVRKMKPAERIRDQTFILMDLADKAIRETKALVREILLKNGYSEQTVEKILTALTSGEKTHDYPITFKEAREIGLRVSSNVPKEIYGLLSLYPTRGIRSPVQYIPVPYKRAK